MNTKQPLRVPARRDCSQETLSPSNHHCHSDSNIVASNMATPSIASRTPRGTRSTCHAVDRGDVDNTLMHEKLSQRRLAIYDRVYGQILFPPVIRLFIDSPEVQRLRDLKQLGCGHYVYPSATHTRFEHSLGVSHLAMRFLKQLFTNHAEEPDVGENLLNLFCDGSIDKQKAIWCVGIAGLCHDLGHGPLSHMFETYVNSVRADEGKPKWSHEQASITMLRSIWHSKREQLAAFHLGDEDLAFVELLINGLKPGAKWPANVGRSADMRFMTDIIANKRSGLDVDKMDYIQRDSLSCFGARELVCLDRLFQGACVMCNTDGESQICYQEKLEDSINEIFHARTKLHKRVYQHRVTCVMDTMAIDAFLLADPHFMIAYGGKQYRLSECVDCPGAYVQTGDWMLSAILRSHESRLKPAREILDRIQNRLIYTTIGTSVGINIGTEKKQIDYIRRVDNPDLRDRLMDWNRAHSAFPAIGEIQTKFTKAAADMTNANEPVDNICFYNPRHGASATPLSRIANELSLYGARFSQRSDVEQTSIVICRMPLSTDDLNAVVDAFNQVAVNNGAVDVADRSVSPSGRRGPSSSRHATPWGLDPQTPPLSQRQCCSRPLSAVKRGRDQFEADAVGENGTDTHRNRTGESALASSRRDLRPAPEKNVEGEEDRRATHPQWMHDDGDLMAPPVRICLRNERLAGRGVAGFSNGDKALSLRPERTRIVENASNRDDIIDVEDDVELSMHPISQVENSQLNAEEPDIRVGVSNASERSLDGGEVNGVRGEGSRQGIPTTLSSTRAEEPRSQSSTGKKRPMVTFGESERENQ